MPNCATPLRKAALVGPSPSGREPLASVIALSPRQSAALTLVLPPAAALTTGGGGGTSRRAHNDAAVLDPLKSMAMRYANGEPHGAGTKGMLAPNTVPW